MNPLWQKLVEDLKEQQVSSPYLKRLDAKLGALSSGHQNCGWKSLQIEIMQEMVQALGNAEDKLNVALLELELVGKAFDEVISVDDEEKLCNQFNEKRKDAIRAKWELIVQREVLGFYHTPEMDRIYPIPEQRNFRRVMTSRNEAGTDSEAGEQGNSPLPRPFFKRLFRRLLSMFRRQNSRGERGETGIYWSPHMGSSLSAWGLFWNNENL